MRNPRMQGLPPLLPGSMVMRCSQFMHDRVACACTKIKRLRRLCQATVEMSGLCEGRCRVYVSCRQQPFASWMRGRETTVSGTVC